MIRRYTALILVGTTISHHCFAFVPAKNALLPRKLGMVTQQQEEQATAAKLADKELNPRLLGLSLMLDDGTRKSHSMAENTAFVSGFFKGVSTPEAYRNLVTSLYCVYDAMEQAMDTTKDTNVQALDDPVLRRFPALKQDMNYFYGSEWQDVIRPTPATQKYVARIKKVAKHHPYLLIGHQYSRYLGDLFGGQMMGNMATRSLDLKDGNGVAFYRFDDILNTKDYIAEWYQRLNNLDLTEEQKQEIVDEANLVFSLNIGIFEELEGSSFKALWTMTVNTMKIKLGLV